MAGTARRATAEKEWSSTELERARSDLSAKTAAERAARAEAADETTRADKVQRLLDDADAKAQRAMTLADEVWERTGHTSCVFALVSRLLMARTAGD